MAGAREVAIVTGAARGIGRAAAESLGRRGFAAALVDRRGDTVRETASGVAAQGVETLALVGDDAGVGHTQALGERTRSTWGRSDALASVSPSVSAGEVIDVDGGQWVS